MTSCQTTPSMRMWTNSWRHVEVSFFWCGWEVGKEIRDKIMDTPFQTDFEEELKAGDLNYFELFWIEITHSEARPSGNASPVATRSSPLQYDPPPLPRTCQMPLLQGSKRPSWMSWATRLGPSSTVACSCFFWGHEGEGALGLCIALHRSGHFLPSWQRRYPVWAAICREDLSTRRFSCAQPAKRWCAVRPARQGWCRALTVLAFQLERGSP